MSRSGRMVYQILTRWAIERIFSCRIGWDTTTLRFHYFVRGDKEQFCFVDGQWYSFEYQKEEYCLQFEDHEELVKDVVPGKVMKVSPPEGIFFSHTRIESLPGQCPIEGLIFEGVSLDW